jgi:hypothetical protein
MKRLSRTILKSWCIQRVRHQKINIARAPPETATASSSVRADDRPAARLKLVLNRTRQSILRFKAGSDKA